MDEEKRRDNRISSNRQLIVDDKIQLTIHLKLIVLKLKEVIGGLRGTHFERRRGQLAITIGDDDEVFDAESR